MGTFAEYIGTMDIPENQRAEYARQMLRLLHAGGMMSVDEVGLFGHRIRLLYPPELDETGRAWGCYNYFEDEFWESWGLNVDTGTFSSNKIGGGAFRTAVLAGYVLTALYSQSYDIVTVDGSYVRERRLIGWINGVLGTQYTNRRATQLWEVERLLHKDGCDEYNKDLTGLIHDVPTGCADLKQIESYLAARYFEEFDAGMSAEAEDAAVYRKEDTIGVRNCFAHLKKTLSALHKRGGTLEEAKKYLLMPMDERSAVIDKQGGSTLAFSYCFVSPALAVAMTAREFGVDFWALWDELGADIPSVGRFPAPQSCPPVEPVSTQELFGVAPDDMAYYWQPDGKVQFSDEMTAWMQALRAELDGITDTIPPEKFLQAMVDTIAGAGSYAFRDMFYGFIARQAEPKVQAAVLLLNRLVECGEPNVRRYLAILGNPALREAVFGF